MTFPAFFEQWLLMFLCKNSLQPMWYWTTSSTVVNFASSFAAWCPYKLFLVVVFVVLAIYINIHTRRSMYTGHPSLSTLCRQLPPIYEAILSTLSDKPGKGAKFASSTPKPRTAYNTGSLLYFVATGYTSTPFSVLHFTVSVSCFTASSCAGQANTACG